ncbi:MAG: class I SAM-dependent methyltransferase [Lachnospiraceae bacterium]|nr:class I SAM-dependent methyltransferase [Lachnospiraceae bacterium]
MDKTLHIVTEQIQNDGTDTYYCHRYEPSPYSVLDYIFTEYPLSKSDVLIDFGCGMGRLNFYLNHRFHCKTIGVELNPVYYEACIKNNASYHRHTKGAKEQATYPDIRFYHESADSYVVDDTINHFYFFNPFSIEIFRKVIDHIYESLDRVSRSVTLLLYYPDAEYTYYLDTCTPFDLITEIPLSGYAKNVQERVVVYRYCHDL